MFFTFVGVSFCIYTIGYTLLTLFSDCDVQLLLYKTFGRSPRRLKGKVAFITGASSGVGEYTAYSLAKCGVKLILAARRNDELQRVKRQCVEVSNGQLEDKDVLVIPMDITDFSSHEKHFRHAIGHFGHVDILLNNAGRSQRAIWDNIELAVDKQLFDLNVFGVVNLSRVALEHFNRQGSGHIAVVSSLAGVIGAPYSGSYTGSKHAIQGYFKSLDIEKTRANIDVTILCPGPIFTNFLAESFTEKDGEKYNVPVQPTDKRMTAQRCGELIAVALANKTREAWIANSPLIMFTYAAVYCPVISFMALKVLGPEFLFKLRDTKTVDEVLTV